MHKAKPLTQREQEVLTQLLQGQSNRQIAYSLQISIRTVEFHLTNIYAKFNVSSRVELILHLVNTAGQLKRAKPGVSTAEKIKQFLNNRIIEKSISALFRKELDVKKRWPLYLLIGFVFGAAYFFYLGLTSKLLGPVYAGDNLLILIPLYALALFIYLGVWLIPGILPAIYELKHASPTHQAILAVVMVCLSGVTGYYASYWVMLALVGVPNMEFLLITGGASATAQSLWAEWFPRLIGLKWVKWTLVGSVLSAGVAFVATKIYQRVQLKTQSA